MNQCYVSNFHNFWSCCRVLCIFAWRYQELLWHNKTVNFYLLQSVYFQWTPLHSWPPLSRMTCSQLWFIQGDISCVCVASTRRERILHDFCSADLMYVWFHNELYLGIVLLFIRNSLALIGGRFDFLVCISQNFFWVFVLQSQLLRWGIFFCF